MKFLPIFLLLSICLASQDRNDISFESELVTWQDYNWVDSLSVYDQKFLILQEPVVIDDKYLLTVSSINPFFFGEAGYLISFKHIDTGEIIWERIEFSKEKFTRKFLNNFLIKGEVLELYIIEEGKNLENLFYPSWEQGYLSLLNINIYTGEIISEIRTDHYDDANVVHENQRFYLLRTYFGYKNNVFKKSIYTSQINL